MRVKQISPASRAAAAIKYQKPELPGLTGDMAADSAAGVSLAGCASPAATAFAVCGWFSAWCFCDHTQKATVAVHVGMASTLGMVFIMKLGRSEEHTAEVQSLRHL